MKVKKFNSVTLYNKSFNFRDEPQFFIPLGWAMGSSQRLAAVAAVSHARHYYNHTQADVLQTETSSYSINIFFASVTLCGVLVAVCAACWRRSPASDKPEDSTDCHGVYTVSGDTRLTQLSY
ncbi:hypothetical protein HW555_000267 [Spodoptera exigua]|uniref:Uncharacterized protein n=1 Tax=Spodoptera exigua TaxID=7107 RepID=A0A835GSB4_SPOEX|nr:hypothetical protein HW555_000267 [Spodoptera exigua]